MRAVVRRYLPDLVFGANDGIIMTFAVVSGVVGASLSNRIILILGFANLVADGSRCCWWGRWQRRSPTRSVPWLPS